MHCKLNKFKLNGVHHILYYVQFLTFRALLLFPQNKYIIKYLSSLFCDNLRGYPIIYDI